MATRNGPESDRHPWRPTYKRAFEEGQVISQEGFDGLPHGVIAVEIALVGEAVDPRFGELYQDQVCAAALTRAMRFYPCRGGRTSFSQRWFFHIV
jgi:hypothetical protein